MMWKDAMVSAKAVVSTPPPTTIWASSARRTGVLSQSGRREERISWKMVVLASLDLMDSPERVRAMRVRWSLGVQFLGLELICDRCVMI
jgi:hypothetical protein